MNRFFLPTRSGWSARSGHSGSAAILLVVLALATSGCVTKSSYDDLESRYRAISAERNELNERNEVLALERDTLEQQYYETLESYEDERVTRTTLAEDLSRTKRRASRLDEDLDAERRAREAAAAALAAREAEIAAMQSTYDELVSDLESEVSSGQIEIERLREGLRLNVSDEVLFATGSAALDSIGREVLSKVAGQLTELGDFIEVRGHTDSLPIRGALSKRYPSNWELAAARAASVVRLLESKGVPGDRLAAVSLGSFDPVAPNDTADNRALNRRIEIRLLPKRGRTGTETEQDEELSDEAGGAAGGEAAS